MTHTTMMSCALMSLQGAKRYTVFPSSRAPSDVNPTPQRYVDRRVTCLHAHQSVEQVDEASGAT